MSKGLALTRQADEGKNELIFIIENSDGNQIAIKQTIKFIKGRQVRVDIQAPDAVHILRGELAG